MNRDDALRGPALAAAAAIEAELRRLGWWSATPPSAEAMQGPGAFGTRTLAVSQWLQFVLLPRVREAAAQGGFVRASNVALGLFRELSEYDDTARLLSLLRAFDDLFQPTLFRCAAAWDPAVERFLADPSLVADPALYGLAERHDEATWRANAADLDALLDAGSEVDCPDPRSGRTPLMTAIAFGCDPVEAHLLRRGADTTRADREGRTAADFRRLRLQARLGAVLDGLAGVRSARLAQIYLPDERRIVANVVALELDGPIDTAAFRDLPQTDPAVIMTLGTDAVSAAVGATAPFWVAPLR